MPADHNKLLLQPYIKSLYNFDRDLLKSQLIRLFDKHAEIHLAFPFEDLDGPDELFERAFIPLADAMPDMERRDLIVIAGESQQQEHWVGCAGYYTGTFLKPWLDIPPSGHQAAMRFHEFYRIENDKIIEMQALWDIPEMMMQANAWPMSPSLGREWLVPGPATQDGLAQMPANQSMCRENVKLVSDMLAAMKRHPSQGGPEVMEMEKYWHRKMNWYGPAGIGTCRGIEGFRHWHQIPFLNALPDRGLYKEEVDYRIFGQGDYVAVTGWPNMIQTITHDGWLGIAPIGKKFTMRSLDFWRIENGLIRENWVMVDLLNMYDQLGVDVFARLREFNKSRNLGPITPLKSSDTV